jgi:hypothetical protein
MLCLNIKLETSSVLAVVLAVLRPTVGRVLRRAGGLAGLKERRRETAAKLKTGNQKESKSTRLFDNLREARSRSNTSSSDKSPHFFIPLGFESKLNPNPRIEVACIRLCWSFERCLFKRVKEHHVVVYSDCQFPLSPSF